MVAMSLDLVQLPAFFGTLVLSVAAAMSEEIDRFKAGSGT